MPPADGSSTVAYRFATNQTISTYTHTHTHLTALFPGLPRWASTRKVKPIWILLEQETVSGSGNSWAICKSAPCSRQTTMPAPHHSVFYRPDALPATQPTVSKHWRHVPCAISTYMYIKTARVIQKSWRIYVHLWMGLQSAHLWWPVVVKLHHGTVLFSTHCVQL